ncbi:MAG: LysM peptidoglycan-binding domain-containing protein [Anaerolineales bacterium]|nr:LysM peptidoglycan-binding domain-containing protein [Anaerolineales bacterium]MCB9005524.1 LysM peptidoglycan-binding domain-containing protein [Ardenticatenaceae bacterium]
MNPKLLTMLAFLLIAWLLPDFGASAQTAVPDTAYINGVTGHAQGYNLSCESRAAADWATFFGVPITENEFLFNLPRSDNPDKGFVGAVNDPWGNTPPYSYGVHAGPVAQLLREYGLDATAQHGLSWDDLRAEVGNGRPVIVWVIGNIWSGTAQTYIANDGSSTIVAPYEHTMILIGYDPTSVYLVNPASGLVEWHSLSSFLSSWAVLGNMAVMAGTPTPAVSNEAQTYVVQPGDSLLTIAAQFGLSWYELAVFNNLTTPDVIYAGQILRLPTAVQTTPAPTPAAPEPTPEPTPAPSPTPEPTPAPHATHTVQRGEHLMQIARTLGLDWQAIAQLNNLQPPQYVVYPEQVLLLPGPISEETPAATAETTQDSYVVQPGDTLFKIATRFGLDWPTLAQLNGIGYPYPIYAGQTLRLR